MIYISLSRAHAKVLGVCYPLMFPFLRFIGDWRLWSKKFEQQMLGVSKVEDKVTCKDFTWM